MKALFCKGLRALAFALGFAFGFAFGMVISSELTPAPLASVFRTEVAGRVGREPSKITHELTKALVKNSFLLKGKK